MRKLYFFLFFIIFFSQPGGILFAQVPGISGINICYAGAWLEIGEQSNGDFGVQVAPAGYHIHCATCDYTTALAEVYDYGHDGWTVGAPAYMGDYTYPGDPFEGWEIQFTATGASRAQAFCTGAATGAYTNVGGAGLTGALTTFSDAGGQQIGNWAGTASGGNLTIKQATEVDTFGSAVVVTTKLYNTSAANIDSIYYMRTCDPDNNETWGGSFITENWIDYQNTDLYHRVQVHATTDIPTPNLYPFALGTKDCRAVCLIYEDWPMSDAQNLTPVWDKSYVGGGSWYTISAGAPDVTDDIAIALVFQIGTICPGDSNFVSYSYIFNGATSGIDSALPEPALNVNGITITPAVLPNATYDTFNTCLYPGMTTLPVNIINATTGDWTWSTWTWSPGTGLSTTAGVTNIINITALPPEITYTITGTGYTTSCGSPAICATRVFYLTIHTCNGATNNNPCIGDTVIFNAPGDSLGATYAWVGPNSYTTTVATTQTFTVYPSVWADTGTYYVIKTISGTSDTSITHLTLYPNPTVTASSNSPLCIGAANTLSLTATPGTVPVTTYGWTGPDGFTSALQDPTIPGFTAPDTGIYTVIVTTAYGCKDTAGTHVIVLPPPVAPIVTDPSPYCQGNTFIPFSISGITGTVYWYPTAAGGTGTTTAPTVNTSIPGTYTYYYGQTVGLCESPIDSIKVLVNPTPAPISGPANVCQYFSISLTDASAGGSWISSAPAVATINSSGVVYGVTAGVAAITYTLPTTCYTTTNVNVHPKPAAPVVSPPSYCQFAYANQLNSSVTSPATGLVYYGPGVTAGTIFAPTPLTLTPGITNYWITDSSSFGCISDSTVDPVTIIPQPAPPVTGNSTYCQYSHTVPLNYQVDSAADSHLTWYIDSIGGAVIDSTPSPPNDLVTYPSGTTWYVSQTVGGCVSNRAPVTVTIVYKPDFTITESNSWVCDHDTLSFAYSSSAPLLEGSYHWQLPSGATIVSGTATDSAISVRFDSINEHIVIYLTVGELNQMCTTTDTLQITVIALPTATAYMNPNICVGDTTSLALSSESSDASVFAWYIDGTPLGSSNEVNIVSASSNSGGPFSLSWNTPGSHIITVTTTTTQGCTSPPTNDTVDVHPLPDATFTFKPKSNNTLCLEDSVEFIANDTAYNDAFLWSPAHSFNNDNKPVIWGKVEETQSDITLTVTDPFGCMATSTQQLDPSACCTVMFPNAFTPNGDGKDDYFRPLFSGFHNFHSFRIVNRWGQTIFESANSLPQWDGTFNGVPQDIGTYYYFIEYDCGGNTVEAKGDVTLIR